MIVRMLFWLAVIYLVVLALRKTFGRQTTSKPGRRAQRETEKMLCCAACQTYVPQSEAVMRGERAYCCEAHAAQD